MPHKTKRMGNSTKGLIACLLVACACSSCSMFSAHEGYTYNKKLGFYYKLQAFADTYVTAHPGDVVSVRLSFSDVGSDSVWEEKSMEVVASEHSALDLPLLMLDIHTGDSITYIIPKKNISDNSFIPRVLWNDTTSEVQFSVYVRAVTDSVTYAEQKKKNELWLQTKRDYETFLIEQYLKKRKERYTQLRSGIYKRIIKNGRGNYPEIGDNVSISYQGSLLDGTIFNHFTSFDFSFGAEYQVVKGIEIVLRTMKRGERAKIIVPSEYAWGESGSSDGSVPPYTPVVFDLELK